MADTDIGGYEVLEHLEGSIVKQDVIFEALHQKRKLNGRRMEVALIWDLVFSPLLNLFVSDLWLGLVKHFG